MTGLPETRAGVATTSPLFPFVKYVQECGAAASKVLSVVCWLRIEMPASHLDKIWDLISEVTFGND